MTIVWKVNVNVKMCYCKSVIIISYLCPQKQVMLSEIGLSHKLGVALLHSSNQCKTKTLFNK